MEDPLRQDLTDPPQIIETMGWRPGEGLRWRDDHLARMVRTAARLGYAFDRAQALAHLAGIGGEPAAPGNSEEEYIAAYEAAWETGNALAIENDPRG